MRMARVTLHFLDALGQDAGLQRHALSGSRGQHTRAAGHFGLEKGWLIQQVITVAVVAGQFDRQHVLPRFEPPGQIPLVDPEVPRCGPGRAAAEKLPVEPGAVERCGSNSQFCLASRRCRKGRPKTDRHVHLRLTAFRHTGRADKNGSPGSVAEPGSVTPMAVMRDIASAPAETPDRNCLRETLGRIMLDLVSSVCMDMGELLQGIVGSSNLGTIH